MHKLKHLLLLAGACAASLAGAAMANGEKRRRFVVAFVTAAAVVALVAAMPGVAGAAGATQTVETFTNQPGGSSSSRTRAAANWSADTRSTPAGCTRRRRQPARCRL